jgi:hypothetical protein
VLGGLNGVVRAGARVRQSWNFDDLGWLLVATKVSPAKDLYQRRKLTTLGGDLCPEEAATEKA